MAVNPGSSPIAPLSPGNVVSAAFQLYRENAKQYLGIALVSVGWSLLPFVGFIAIAIIAAIVIGATQQPTLGIGLGVLAVIAVVVFAFFCVARSLANAALICRLAFFETANQRVDLAEARRFVNSRKWNFLGVQVRVGFIVAGIVFGFYLLIGLLAVIVALAAGGRGGGGGNPAIALIFGLLIVALVVVAVVVFLRFSARLFGAEVPLAIEDNMSGGSSISRFWTLSKGSEWRIILITLVAFAATLPVLILSNIIQAVPQGMIEGTAQQGTNEYAVLTLITSLIAIVISLLLNVLVLPLWQVLKAIVYYDLRNRREGLDLQIRDR